MTPMVFLLALGATTLLTWRPIYMPHPSLFEIDVVQRSYTDIEERFQAIQEQIDQIFMFSTYFVSVGASLALERARDCKGCALCAMLE